MYLGNLLSKGYLGKNVHARIEIAKANFNKMRAAQTGGLKQELKKILVKTSFQSMITLKSQRKSLRKANIAIMEVFEVLVWRKLSRI